MKMRMISVLDGMIEGISSDSAGVLILYHFQELILSFAVLAMNISRILIARLAN